MFKTLIGSVVLLLLQQKPDMDVGINLAPVNDWNREWVFTDLSLSRRDWRLITDGQIQPKGLPINNLDMVPFSNDDGVQTMVLTNQDRHIPVGIYHIYYEGNSVLRFSGGTEVSKVKIGNGTYIRVKVSAALSIEIYEAKPTKLVIIWPDLLSYKGVFHPVFVKDLRRFNFIRFLNWMNTNSVTKTRKWEERTLPSQRQSYTPDGVAIENMVRLCNATDADPWFCMPHLYEFSYMDRFARYVKGNLEPDRKIYVEFSNETWNAIFPQHDWAKRESASKSLKWPEFVADEAEKMWDIWLTTFADSPQRVVRVIGGNAASTWPIETMLERWGDYKPDMVAVASYFGPTPDQIRTMDPSITAEKLLEMSMANISLRKSFIQNHIRVCQSRSIPVGVYEGGQGIVGKDGWLDSVYEAQILPTMYGATYQMLEEANALGCPVYGVFQYSGDRVDRHGSWGHLEYQDHVFLAPREFRIEAPKMAAVRDFINGVK